MRISRQGRKTLIFGTANGLPSDAEAERILASLRDDPNAKDKLYEGFLRVTAAILRHLAAQNDGKPSSA